nr:hypothetical protein [Tanacetum cinerariifolium]
MKFEESLNVTFDETPPPPKTSPLEDDELVEEEAIESFHFQSLQETKNQHHSTKITVCGFSQDNTKTPLPKLQLSSPSAPNAPSKTPLTKDTSSSLIDYTPKSPTLSPSPSINGYLNLPFSPPPRVPPPPPTQETQENASIDITLTLSPITRAASLSLRGPPTYLRGPPIDKRKLCKVLSAIRELVDIVKKTLELGARGVEYGEEAALVSYSCSLSIQSDDTSSSGPKSK